MGRISRENIEEYLLDYLEGNLDSNTHKEVKDFLLLHPDIEEDLMGMEDTYLEKTQICYPDKEILKESLEIRNFEDKCIMSVEKQLSTEETDALNKEAESNQLKSDILKLYNHTVLSPDQSVIFENKSSLKHRMAFGYRRVMYYSSAAAIVLLISISSLLMKKSDTQGEYTAEYFNYLNKELQQKNSADSNITLTKEKNSDAEYIAEDIHKTDAPIEYERETKTNTEKRRTIIVGNTKKTEEIVASKTPGSNISVSATENIEKVSTIDITAKSKTMLASSIFDIPEPGDIVLPEKKYAISNKTDMLTSNESETWASFNDASNNDEEKKINSLVRMGETKVRTLLSRFVSVTKIQHERVVYVEQKSP